MTKTKPEEWSMRGIGVIAHKCGRCRKTRPVRLAFDASQGLPPVRWLCKPCIAVLDGELRKGA